MTDRKNLSPWGDWTPAGEKSRVFLKRAIAPPSSWWAAAPRQGFTARCRQEYIRMAPTGTTLAGGGVVE